MKYCSKHLIHYILALESRRHSKLDNVYEVGAGCLNYHSFQAVEFAGQNIPQWGAWLVYMGPGYQAWYYILNWDTATLMLSLNCETYFWKM